MGAPIHRLAYLSERRVDASGLAAMLDAARARNLADGITGILLADASHFVQVVEGARGAVADLALRLLSDPRHAGIRVLASEEAELKWFSDWKMRLALVPSHCFAVSRRAPTARPRSCSRC
ncbi:BLUF domain-containing protein [Roseibacterium sp. SDUM158017]|uniref:BLUF domain-containing protein n=1 Tax=Roseicyclus salinarum TaxID=3036773 RepID=UPI002415283E|nr:BLUF domain-containing protein [Roseibacterium sp. SDUM158017]MDG4647319.1 BLUF domain-containing protein [Roseibacterium sp. SDUM158017]